jgi:hypothetical protein
MQTNLFPIDRPVRTFPSANQFVQIADPRQSFPAVPGSVQTQIDKKVIEGQNALFGTAHIQGIHAIP